MDDAEASSSLPECPAAWRVLHTRRQQFSAQLLATSRATRQAWSVKDVILPIATAVVLAVRGEKISVTGTCFPYRDRTVFLTAAHCVPEGLQFVVLQGRTHQRGVVEIKRRPEWDVALIRTEATSSPYDQPSLATINTLAPDLSIGGDFLTF